MLWRLIAASCLALTLCQPLPADDLTLDGVVVTETEKAMVEYLNHFRHRNGLAPLRITANLMARARGHANWMASHRSMTHSSGIRENIAMGQRSAAEVTGVWEHSGGHNANMRTGDREVGVGSVGGYWAQQFATGSDGWGKPKEPSSEPTAVAGTAPAQQNQTSLHHRRRIFRRG